MTDIAIVLLVGFILLALWLFNGVRAEEKKIIVKEPFVTKWANQLYRLSYQVPFVWFVNPNQMDKKVMETEKMLVQANISKYFNYRSYMAFRLALLTTSAILYVVILLMMSHSAIVLQYLFNIQPPSNPMFAPSPSTMKEKIAILLLLMAIQLAPSMVVKRRANAYRTSYMVDIPIIQLFIILMLRSKKTIGDILFALSKINTRYQSVFESGYLIFLRNKEEGLGYIATHFDGTTFRETITVLEEMGEYSREDSIRLLENNMQQTIERNNANRRRGDLSKLVVSQSSIVLPFIAIVVLGFLPIAMLGIELFQRAGLNF